MLRVLSAGLCDGSEVRLVAWTSGFLGIWEDWAMARRT
jgi:hypothetical protein